MKKELILLFLIFLITSCTEDKKQPEIKQLQHEVLDLPDMMIGSPGDIQKEGDCLLVLDIQQDSLFHRVDLANNRYRGMFGAKGQGPDELIHPCGLKALGDGRWACFDLGKNDVNMISLDADGNMVGLSRMFKNKAFMTFNIVPLSEELFILNGETDGAMLALIDKEGTVLSVSDEYPYKDDAEKNIPVRFRAMAYQGTLRVNDNGYVAYAFHGAKQVHLYKVENKMMKKVGEVIDGYGHYKPDMRREGAYGSAHDSNYPECYLDLALTDKHVYALYSGRTYKEYRLSAFEGETVYVYDWTGNLLKTYQLDVPITRFCIDDEEQVMYATANVPEPTIVSFELE